MDSKTLFSEIANKKVFIVGDVMLDNYWFGHSERMSPEAPVPIVTLEKKESRLGGALNVAANCQALGAETYVLSVIGKDDDGDLLLNICQNEKIQTNFILQDEDRITTTKARVISSDKHLLRIDHEQTVPLQFKTEQKFIENCMKAIQIEKPEVLILQDYNKGVLTPSVIRNIIAHAKEVNCIITVDPKKDNFFAYHGVDIFKPNLKEVKEALGIGELIINQSTLEDIHDRLASKLNHSISFITLSELGVFVQEDKSYALFDAHKRNIVDVSGAGDTVIATASLVYSVTKNKEAMAQIANLAGGLVCEQVGVVTIDKMALQLAIENL